MTFNQASNVQPLRIANASTSVRHVFIRDLTLDCSIGIHAHEKNGPQRIRINLDLAVSETAAPLNDDINNVVCYERISNDIRTLVASGHVNLVETLAESVAALCLTNPLVQTARVRIEKLDVFEDTTSVGVEIERKA
jgi:dihydroneopterin aldolase